MIEVPGSVEDWVNENFSRLAQILQDFDPYLELRYIPPHARVNPQDYARAWAIVDTNPRFKEHVVMYAKHDEDPQKILAKLFRNNSDKNDVLASLDAEEAAARAFEMRKQMDADDLAMDKMKWWMKTPLHTAKIHGVKVDTRTGRRLED